MLDQLLLNSCWDYKCIISSQIYEMLTFNDIAIGIWLWVTYPLAFYGMIRLFVLDIPRLINRLIRRKR